ncbi:TetR/AcrR family transcriptional regulator [Cryobacterium sp. PH29-G1]|uniref:TetR/AcrR family transcriptional regulator n=1 Tax=Cryobacterium sp. PH29-G1 TaxID=3046211 RepID=UPI0024BAB427|nr:TetR/AcrR family transcriptional regulator [Cryobacterium sp. PH29-G1]MDJ0348308.1 TetR/AcrR family transcriptional regulator [Cryobacterium sp. PH29-G1]
MENLEETHPIATRERARLDAESIIEAGLRIASKPGTAAVSVRDLGAMLDAAPTAVYRHFRSKEGLMQALLDRLLAMSTAQVTAPTEAWRERITQLCTATLNVFIAYPAIAVEAIVLSTEGPAELDGVEIMLGAYAQTGLEGTELVRHYAALSTYMLSYASGIARAHSISNTLTAEDSTPWWGRTYPVTASSHPYIAALRDELTALSDREIYFLGINELMDSAERAGAQARERAASAEV